MTPNIYFPDNYVQNIKGFSIHKNLRILAIETENKAKDFTGNNFRFILFLNKKTHAALQIITHFKGKKLTQFILTLKVLFHL